MAPMLTLDSTMLINTLLGKDTTPEIVDQIHAKLKMIVLPWRPDGCMPPKFERLNGLGEKVAVVDGWLGGYGDPHHPHHHGWGYSAGVGVFGYGGACTRGIVKVDSKEGDPEKVIKKCEIAARDEAMRIVDEFLRKERPSITILDEPIKEPR